MLSAIVCLYLSLTVCFGAPAITEDQLRSLIQPLLASSQTTGNDAVNAPPLFASLAAASPLNTLNLDSQPSTSNTDQPSQISPANQQLAQLNLAGGVTGLVKNALGSLVPQTEMAQTPAITPNFGSNAGTGTLYPNFGNNAGTGTLYPNFGNNAGTGTLYPNSILNNYPTYPSGGAVQPLPAPVPARPAAPANNMFNPLSLLGLGGGSSGPFGMLMPSLMMRMLERLMEFF